MKRTILSAKDVDFLTRTIARNKERFGGFFMGPEDNKADDENADDADADGDDDKSDDGADDDQSDETDWKAKFEAEQRHKRNLERKARKDAATIERLTGKKPEGGGKDAADKGEESDKPDLDKIREEAKAEAKMEALHGRVEDKIEAKAHAFADPEDAVAVLLRSRKIEDFIDGDKVDVEEITEALKELGEKKPHLLAQGGKKFQGDADGGTRKESKGRPKNLGDAVARHYDKK